MLRALSADRTPQLQNFVLVEIGTVAQCRHLPAKRAAWYLERDVIGCLRGLSAKVVWSVFVLFTPCSCFSLLPCRQTVVFKESCPVCVLPSGIYGLI